MALKVVFEIGHEASIRTKKTHEGFTHDWEVYVRGVDNADISQFVDKVIFILHDTFNKPKRVIKEPPYVVRESGYAGFNFPIEIHLKNREEPKIVTFNYDLQLQTSGPAISKLQKEKYVFSNPSEEFKRKLLKGGAASVSGASSYVPHEHERNSRDSFTEEKPPQLIGKPKLGGDGVKKHKQKDYRADDLPRSSNHLDSLFGTPIHKSSSIPSDLKKPSPNPKFDKKDKDKQASDRDKIKTKHETKEHREEKKLSKEEKEKSKLDRKSKNHKSGDAKEKKMKRPPDKAMSPSPPAKRPAVAIQSPRRVPSPSNKSNSSVSSKEESKPAKHANIVDVKKNSFPPGDLIPMKSDKKLKKEKKGHDQLRESKKEQKDRELKNNIHEIKDIKLKESINKNLNTSKEKDKEKPPEKPPKAINKFSIVNMLKDPADAVKYADPSKHKGKSDRERKHKHKKKDKKRDESRDKNKDPFAKEKKHKHDKHKDKVLDNKEVVVEKIDNLSVPKENDKNKNFKDKERSQLTISPISLDTSSQSSSKSASKTSITSKTALGSIIEDLIDSDSDQLVLSEEEETSFNMNNRNSKLSSKSTEPQGKIESKLSELPKLEKPPEKINPGSSHRLSKKEKPTKLEAKEEKKQRKRKSNTKDESENPTKIPKSDDADHIKNKRLDPANNPPETSQKSVKTKSDTKVQDDGVSSSLSDNPPKCESPITEPDSQATVGSNEISSDYMIQLRELQHRIMTIQSNDELERVVNLIAETGKYEVTKKTFDFDLCLLDRSTVQQLQELIGCESRA